MSAIKTTVLALTTAIMVTGAAYAYPVYVQPAPPAEIVEAVPPPPGPTMIWVWQKGHWRWNGYGYHWVAGHWVKHPRWHNVWVAPRWVPGPGGWVYVEGHWK